MNFVRRPNKSGDKIYFYYDLGRGKGQRHSTAIFIYARPHNQVQKNHNKEAMRLLEVKKSQLILDRQAIGSSFIPAHKIKSNFLVYYNEYVVTNTRNGNRHLKNSLNQFRIFVRKDILPPHEITEDFCKRFRQYLLDNFTGETPSGYFARFKRVMNAATKEGYFHNNPASGIKCKSNPSKRIKENLESEEYIQLLETPCLNQELREAFILSCYTGLRWVDVKRLEWSDINGSLLTTRIIQSKTGKPLTITIHPIARAILEKHRQNYSNSQARKVFSLPGDNGCNKTLQHWVSNAGINKHITWHCARLSFSILLQDENVDAATVALLLGQTSTKYVLTTYKRHRPKDQSSSISKLPMPEQMPSFLDR